jgi:type IX secretion system PorP/SprF family membrane protein
MSNGQQIFDASIGGHMLYDEKLFISLSLPNTIRTRLDEVPVDDQEQGGALFSHYIFQLGYIANIASQNFKVIPSLTMRKIRDTPYQIDLNIQGRFLDEKLIAGLTFRPSDKGAAAFLLGTKYKHIQMFYSYDLSFSRFQQYNGGSHELSVAFNLPAKAKSAAPASTEIYQ